MALFSRGPDDVKTAVACFWLDGVTDGNEFCQDIRSLIRFQNGERRRLNIYLVPVSINLDPESPVN